jgi:hypothetical protein
LNFFYGHAPCRFDVPAIRILITKLLTVAIIK